eukprot:9419026-Lingulodinium_polyedra.AAC.1
MTRRSPFSPENHKHKHNYTRNTLALARALKRTTTAITICETAARVARRPVARYAAPRCGKAR